MKLSKLPLLKITKNHEMLKVIVILVSLLAPAYSYAETILVSLSSLKPTGLLEESTAYSNAQLQSKGLKLHLIEIEGVPVSWVYVLGSKENIEKVSGLYFVNEDGSKLSSQQNNHGKGYSNDLHYIDKNINLKGVNTSKVKIKIILK